MHGTMDDWRAARAALLDELTRLRQQLSCGEPLGRSEIHAPRAGIDMLRRSALSATPTGFAGAASVLR
jgi:hypothetical protein